MSSLRLNSNGDGSNTCSRYSELDSIIASEKEVEELLQQPVQGLDEHLIEFSEAMRTVAKALRRAAEGKASSKAEAAEWKRKFELERAKNFRLEHKDLSTKETDDELHGGRASYLNHQSEMVADGCDGNGIRNLEVLRDGDADCKWGLVNGNTLKKETRHLPGQERQVSSSDGLVDSALGRPWFPKASFILQWNNKDEKSNQYKHDVVSFARGDIVTTQRSSTQISLKWETSPQTVLVLTKPNSASVQILCAEIIRWLTQAKKLNILVEPRVRSALLEESAYFDFVETWSDEEEISLLHTKVDLVVTLGGDGTVLWAASLFKGPIPPIVPFALGSLGFMTPFYSENYRESLDSILRGPLSITLRHRLQCWVIRDAAKDELETEEPILVLNEVTIDRGFSSFITNLECYCDNSFVTTVQGDGLILSTTSGSTAYSLASGGSMVHPQVPGILFTPICPHSLSFRPLMLPEHVTLRVQVPFNSRNTAWVSFDGKDRKKLEPGDALLCSMAPWPVPTACHVDSTNDFLHSIHEGLHWNLRKTQSSDGTRDL